MVQVPRDGCATHVIRRKNLLSLIKKTYPQHTGALLLVSAFESDREPFYQDSSFYYIVGLLEPGTVVFQPLDGEAVLYEPNYQIERSVWAPVMYDKKYLQEFEIYHQEPLGQKVPGYSIDSFSLAESYSNLADHLKERIRKGEYIFTLLSEVRFECRTIIDKLCFLVPELRNYIIDIAPLIAQMRRKKEQVELEYLYRAIEITAIAQEAAAGVIKVGRRESDVQAAIDYIFTEAQSVRAFPSIVGSGKNSTVLHYVDNNGVLGDGDLVVIDIGASFNHYCGDITRTYPVSGKFTDRQKEIYEIVLKTQEYIAAQARPGVWIKNSENPEKSLNYMAQKFLKEQGYEKYFPHGIGHFVGLDVHDVGDYKQPLAEGDVITIEPGIYIPEEKIGIRIEDMYWIVKGEAVCLSEGIPKIAQDIEDLMKYGQLKDDDNLK